VYKVEHRIDSSSYTTALDFTKVKKKPEDYIADFAKQARVAENNSVTTASNTTADQDGSAEYNTTSDTSDEGDSGYTDTSTYEDNTDYTENY
jgi:S-adenosylmethionine synthetase